MNREKTLGEIDRLFRASELLAINLIEKEARKILVADPELQEFIMAMGSCYFTTTNPDRGYRINSGTGILDETDKEEDFQLEFFEMIYELNDQFKVTGCPMRFTAKGELNNNW